MVLTVSWQQITKTRPARRDFRVSKVRSDSHDRRDSLPSIGIMTMRSRDSRAFRLELPGSVEIRADSVTVLQAVTVDQHRSN
jgi:hypothetical protein